jgi:bifunctional DNase/RNase
MNNIKINDILGLLNFVSSTDDFLNKYTRVNGINLYGYEAMDLTNRQGALIMVDNDQYCINVPMNIRSFLNIKTYLDYHTKSVMSSSQIMGIFSNLYGINFVAGIIKDADDDYFETYLITEKDGKFSCVNIYLSDLFCISNSLKFPVYINKEIVDRRKLSFKEISGQMFLY